jgi:hypothetical protein
VVVPVLVGCGGSLATGTPSAVASAPEGVAPPAVASADAGKDDAKRRSPDGVVLDPPPLAPPAAARAHAHGVVSLREPAGDDAVVNLLESFLDAWQRESLDGLLALTASDAGLLDGADHGHAALIESWRQRLRAHDYGRLDGADLLRPERVERWEWDDLTAPQSPPRPPPMHPGDVLVRAPLEVTRVGGERVFGDVVVMVLRRQSGRLRIAAYGENDAR